MRYTSPFALAVKQKPRRDVLCPRAAPAPDEEAARARTITKAQTHFRGIKPSIRIAILRKASHQLYHFKCLEDYVSAGGDGGGSKSPETAAGE